MKYAGKKMGMMPTNKADVENAADAKKPGDAAEDAADTTKKISKSNALGGGLAAAIARAKFGKKNFQRMAAAGK